MSEGVHAPDFPESPPPRQRTATSKNGMVATAHPGATEAGVEVLEAGGNAFDAAVAAALALGVCEHQASGLGGQSMVLLHEAETGYTIALDGSSRAPELATPDTVPQDQRTYGYRAATVPSTPAVMQDLLERYGTLSRAEVLGPAIRLAEEGYPISRLQHLIQRKKLEPLRAGTAAPYFLDDGEPFEPGAVHIQEDLAGTLRGLQVRGFDDFYTGRIGRLVVRDMEAHDGLLTARDLAQVPRPVERPPDEGRWGGRRVFTFPPPGAGRVLLQILQVLDKTPSSLLDPDTPAGALFLARTIHRALVDHDEEPRDPARHALSPHRMVMPARARVLSRELRRGLVPPVPATAPARGAARATAHRTGGETTHLSVMDRQGNAVGITQSIENFYGACAATPGLGFLYNDYIGAFEHDDPRHPYALRPNAVPWSSVAPAIVFRGRKPVLLVGSPGSERIAPAVAQVLLRLRWEDPMDAVEAPRLHAGLDGTASLEAERMRDDIPAALARDGFQVIRRDAYSTYLGCVQLVLRRRGRFVGVADPRRDGTAGGPAS